MSLQRSTAAFKNSIASAADLFPSRPKPVAQPAPPPPAPAPVVKRKRQIANPVAPAPVVYSQPATTDLGQQHLMTQVTYAQAYLKEKEIPISIIEVARHLSLPETSQVFTVLRGNRNPRVHYDATNDTLEFKPLHGIRSSTDLLAFLQRQGTAQGLNVKELKEGWGGATDAIDDLERNGDILVVRTKKENLARMVWGNDKTLFCDVEEEFKTMWHGIRIPPLLEIVGELEEMGLKPASVDPSTVKVEVKRHQKRRRAVNRRGKISNAHMSGILKDSKDLRK